MSLPAKMWRWSGSGSPSTAGPSITTNNHMNRRRFITASAVACVSAMAGCQDDQSTPATPTVDEREDRSPTSPTSTSTPEPTKKDIEVDVAEGDEVSGIIEDISSGERLVFPPGRFTWSDSALVTIDDWGIQCQPNTVFDIPAGWGDGDTGHVLRTVSSTEVADNFTLEQLTFDSAGRAAPQLRLGVRTNARLDGLQYRMNGPTSNGQQGNGITAFVTDPNGRLDIDRYHQFNNGDLGAYGKGNSRVGIYVGSRNSGTIHLTDPVLQGFPNNACYVSRHPGTVVLEGGLLMNNNVSSIRVSGGVEVIDTTVVLDIDRYLEGAGVINASSHNMRGVWGDSRGTSTPGGTISGVSVIVESIQRSTGLVTILENPFMVVEESQFLLNTDKVGIVADKGEIAVRNSDFAGASNGSTAGTGDISGAGNRVATKIDPGAVPVVSENPEFDWSLTHEDTPNREWANE